MTSKIVKYTKVPMSKITVRILPRSQETEMSNVQTNEIGKCHSVSVEDAKATDHCPYKTNNECLPHTNREPREVSVERHISRSG